MSSDLIYLDSYILQQDMRVRMPKTALMNLGLKKGKTTFDIYLDKEQNALVLKVREDKKQDGEENRDEHNSAEL